MSMGIGGCICSWVVSLMILLGGYDMLVMRKLDKIQGVL